jgi:formylglycine-generating enzyme required for sulfatase activity
VAIDACYSVRFDPDWKNRTDGQFKRPGELTDAQKALANYEQYTARVFFTSDNKEDKTPDRSNFAQKLLEGLRAANATDGFLTSKQLFANYVEGATPTPRAGTFGSDEPSSAFLLYDQNAPLKTESTPKETPTDLSDWNAAKATNTIEGYEAYLKKHPSGDFAEAATGKITALRAATPNTKPVMPNTTQTPENGSVADSEMVFVKGGTFTMGCTSEQGSDCESDEKPYHQVTLSDFYIGKYEVTQAEWRKVMGSDPPELYNKGCDQCPVEKVSWNDIQEFLKKLNTTLPAGQKPYRLPTEAEWEYAARGGSISKGYKYAGGNNIEEVAWYLSNYQVSNTYGAQKTTRPVGAKASNELGLFDMSGNVYEWCSDWYGDYPSTAQSNPTGPTSGSYRVIRGGSWDGDPQFCRVAHRSSVTPDSRDGVGFRLARTR